MKTSTKVALAAPVVAGLVGGLGLGTVLKAAPAHACTTYIAGQALSCDPPWGAPGGQPPPPPQAPGWHTGVNGDYGTCDFFPNNPICRRFMG
jgi:hypothetical protein